MTTTVSPRQQLRYGVNAAADLLGVSKSTVWRRIAAREIAHVKEGRRTLITAVELERYAAEGPAKGR